MYVNPQALTFDDLAAAVHRDSGLGQIAAGCTDPTDPSCLPLSPSFQSTNSQASNPLAPYYDPYTAALNVAGTSAIPWGTIGLAAAAGVLLVLMLGKR
jgi:hypothetical protein